MHEDDVDDVAPIIDSDLLQEPTGTSQRTSHPLQEMSPNRSPRKSIPKSETHHDDDRLSHQNTASPAQTVDTLPPVKDLGPDDAPPSRPRLELDAEISDLFKSAASRPSSATAPQSLSKRKNRPLGRAPSGISNRSASTSNHSDRLSTVLASDETFDPASESFTAPPAVVPPSTQIGYETPEAEAHRLEMMKSMGKDIETEGSLKRVGTVKDAFSGVGNRVKGRHRQK